MMNCKRHTLTYRTASARPSRAARSLTTVAQCRESSYYPSSSQEKDEQMAAASTELESAAGEKQRLDRLLGELEAER